MKQGNFGGGMRVAIVALTAFLALSQPLRFGLASTNSKMAAAVGSPHLHALPAATIGVVAIAVLLHSLIMIMIVREIWKLAKVVEGGAFFTKENVASVRRVGVYLISTSALDVAALGMAIASMALSGRQLDPHGIFGQIFNLPVALLLCGLLSLVIARAFNHALKMQREAKYMV